MRLAAMVLMSACIACGAAGASAATVVLTSDTTIGNGNTQFEGDDITVDGVRLTVDGPHNFASLALVNGATLTHSTATVALPVITVQGDVSVDATSSVDVSGRGRNDQGGNRVFGGSYGGWSSNVGGTRPGGPYGSATEPFQHGIGKSRRGGGVIRLIVSGTLTNDGLIASDGQAGNGDYGSGSGGSIWIDAQTLAGSGSIRADGGSTSTLGAGSGGRVAVYYGTNAGFDLSLIRADARAQSNGRTSGAGTVYLAQSASAAELRVVSDVVTTERTPVSPFVGTLLVEGALAEVSGAGFGDASIGSDGYLDVGSDTAFTGTVAADAGGRIRVDATLSGESLVLTDGALVSQRTAASGTTPSVTLEFTDASIDGTSSIDVSGQGRNDQGGSRAYGGSHGGWSSNYGGTRPGSPYGSATQPVTHGIGKSRRGGGVIRLIVSGTLTNDGLIASDGQAGNGNYGSGSGGSIWIDAQTLAGSGSIRADGGSTSTLGAGSGGRVAVYYGTNAGFDLSLIRADARAQSNGRTSGAGTVYLAQRASAAELRVVSDVVTTERTPVSPFVGTLLVEGALAEVSGAGFGDASIGSDGYLDVGSDTAFTGTVAADAGGRIRVDATLSGESLVLTDGALVSQRTAASGTTPSVTLAFTDVSIDATSRIDVSGQGRNDQGGNGVFGGSHGGWSSNFGGTRPSSPYGSATQPVTHGIGRSRRGGGVIRLIVSGTLTNDGLIASDGQAGNGNYGSGSGGSIWIDAQTLAGSGSIRADGGSTSTLGAGSGGRVAVYYGTNAGFDLSLIRADARAQSNGRTSGAGTVYLAQSASAAELRVVSDVVTTERTPVSPFVGTLAVSGALAEVAGIGYGDAIIGAGGFLDVGSDTAFTGTVAADAGGRIRVDATLSGESLVLTDGALVSQRTAASGTTPSVTLAFTDVSIDATSRIDVSGQGRNDQGGNGVFGGSHGGWSSNFGGTRPSSPYGSATQPVTHGIGRSRRGGGVIRLIVSGTLTNDGLIASDGQAGNGNYGSGSGGSIWIDAQTLAGSGSIRADGGSTSTLGAGSGGRVAVYYGTNAGFDLSLIRADARAQSNGRTSGAGTVYLAQNGLVPVLRVSSDVPTAEITPLPSLPVGVEIDGARAQVGGVYDSILVADGGILEPESETGGQVLTVEAGGLVRQAGVYEGAADPSVRLAFDEVYVDAGGAIDVSGQGRASTGGDSRNGGSHGGVGGRFAGVATPALGSISDPGTAGTGSSARRGGGVVSLEVDGLLHVDGAIRANGVSGGGSAGGSAGGSIQIDTQTLSGSGVISADGGSSSIYGAGGGGRIALRYDAIDGFPMANLRALGGDSSIDGGAGTVFLADRLFGTTSVRISNTGRSGGVTPIEEDLDAGLEIADAAILELASNRMVSSVEVGPGARGILRSNVLVRGLLRADGAALDVDGTLAASRLELVNGAILRNATLPAAPTAAKLDVQITDVFIDATSAIDLTARGLTAVSNHSSRNGASHGGLGGLVTLPLNPTFGDLERPFDFGTGPVIERGGGQVKLMVGTLQLDGAIRANGERSNSNYGGGSGGSVWLDVGVVRGQGVVEARGGHPGSTARGGGGGGRVALYYVVLDGFDPQAQISVEGGAASSFPGAPGTVYLESLDVPPQVLGVTPTGFTNEAVTRIEVEFNTRLDAGTVDAGDLVLAGTSGTIVPVTATEIGPTRFAFDLPAELTDDVYTISVGPDLASLGGQPMDQDLDGQAGEPVDDVFVATLTVDREAPPPLAIDDLQAAPTINYVADLLVTIIGNRDETAAVAVDGTERTPQQAGAFAIAVALDPGENTVSLTAVDAAGNVSRAVDLVIFADLEAPTLTANAPSGLANQVPGAIELTVDDIGSGFALPTSTLSFRRNGIVQGGTVGSTPSGASFAPQGGFVDGTWRLFGTLVDAVGNSATVDVELFELDYTPPAPPALDAVPAQVPVPQLTLSGTREAGAEVRVNGELLAAAGPDTTFSGTVTLLPGPNLLAVTQTDAAGNTGAATEVAVVFDDSAPGPVALSVDPNGDGRTLALDWLAYDEAANGGDIAAYRIYTAAVPFTDTASATLAGTTPAGLRQFSLTGLERGVTVSFAVVAVDLQGQVEQTVTSVSAVPIDVVPPAEVGEVSVLNLADGAHFSWQAPDDEDFAGFRVTSDGGAAVDLDAATASYVVSGVPAATRTDLLIKTVDVDGNVSDGALAIAVTWLPNPAVQGSEAFSGRVRLDWAGAAPADLVAAYALYAESSPFTDVSGLAPRLVVPAGTNSASVTGLTNGATYYLAVATVNIAGGTDPAVVPITATPQDDNEGPVISALAYDGGAFADGITLSQPAPWTLTVTDPSGIGTVEFFVDDVLVGADTRGESDARFELDLTAIADGSRVFAVRARDTLGNLSGVVRIATVALAPPGAPTLTEPVSGTRTNIPAIDLRGTTAKDAEIEVLVNGVPQDTLGADPDGEFFTGAALEEGDNLITVRARYAGRAQFGPASTPVTVTLDTAQPDAPIGLVAESRQLGEIRLAWGASPDAAVASYDLYRAEAPFEAIAAATKVNGAPITGDGYTDMPTADGQYFYRVVALNEFGTTSAPSDLAEGVSDSVLPTATVSYAPAGAFDAATGRIAPGTVGMELRASEPLLTRPYLALVPEGGVPDVLELVRDFEDPTLYRTSWQLTADVPTGTVFAVLSALDAVGNRGTEVTAGATLEVDTRGPQVLEVTVNPPAPVRNDPDDIDVPATVEVLIRLDEDVGPGTQVTLRPTLDGTPIAGQEAGLPLVLDALSLPGEPRYRAEFDLPIEAGVDAQGEPQPQTLSFTYSAEDDLGNVEDRLPPGIGVQVYQGELPPLAVPFGLTAEAEVGGRVRLAWNAVDGASGYRLFRQGPGEPAPVELTDVAGTQTLAFVDDGALGFEAPGGGLVEGIYRYAVASERRDNGQTSYSGPSDLVAVTTDSTPPAVPGEFTAELTGAGVVLRWTPPAGEATLQGLTYRVYRVDTPRGQPVNLTGVTPLRDDVPDSPALDTAPSTSAFTYVVTAVDAAGNESTPTDPQYVNADLLPVSALSVALDETGPATIAFTSGGGAITGFAVAVDGVELPDLLPAAVGVSTFVDDTYPAERSDAPIERTYAVTAVDTNDARSLPHEIVLPALSVTRSDVDDVGRPAPAALERNVMNRLWFRVANAGATAAAGVTLEVGVDDEAGGVVTERTHRSARFDVAAGSFTLVPVVIGGYDGLDNLGDLRFALTQAPVEGDAVTLRQREAVAAVDAALVTTLATEAFVRGGTGTVRFSLENTSDVTTEIVLGQSGGDSPDVRLRLEDEAGNVLATSPVRQLTGGVVNLANGFAVARVEPGATFTSGPLPLTVPQGAPDDVVVRLALDRLRYLSGTDDEVVIQGIGATRRATLVETPYVGEVTAIDPLIVAAGAEDRSVRIQGRAVSRRTGAAQPGVPVELVLQVAGFEKSETLVTDGTGAFTYTFRPTASDSGRYAVSVVHPDLVDRPEQGVFTVESLRLRPASFGGDVIRGVAQGLQTTVTAGAATDLEGVRFEYLAEDQPGGVFASSVDVTVDAPRDLAAGESARIGFTFTGRADAAESGRFVLRLVSDDAAGPLGAVTVDYRLTEATPALGYSPTFVELGTALEAQATGVFTVKNSGYAPVLDATVRLERADGSPAPAWLFLSSTADLGTLEVGEERVLEVTAAPGASVPEDDYTFRAVLGGENVGEQIMPVYVAVTESGMGGVLVHVSDIYTATLDESGQPIPGLEGARIKLQNEQVLSELFEATTDAFGNALFADLPAGNYVYRASAFDHQDASGRLRIQPGVVGAQEVFLTNKLVTVEWSVVEIPIQDRYEVRLEATFRTNVPAAVLILEPTVVNLPRLSEGETFFGEFTLTNYGLITAENATSVLPEDDDYLQFEFLAEPPPELLAGEIFTIPYRVTALRDFDAAADADASGAGCAARNYDFEVLASYECAVGQVLPCGALGYFNASGDLSACQATEAQPTPPAVFIAPTPTGVSSGISLGSQRQALTPDTNSGCILDGLLGGCRGEGEGPAN